MTRRKWFAAIAGVILGALGLNAIPKENLCAFGEINLKDAGLYVVSKNGIFIMRRRT